jgi:hypothetical protein
LPPQQNYFTDSHSIMAHIQSKAKGGIVVAYRNCKDYEGMVLGIMIIFDTSQAKYQLDLQWMSFGLDFYGDTLQETYLYQFENLEKVFDYLLANYDIKLTDIPVNYSYDNSQYPDPIKDEAKRPDFEVAWKRFQEDFKTGAFLDSSLKLVFSSQDK